MSYNAEETRNKRAEVAMELLRHKALMQIAKGGPCLLDENDINEVLVVAGVPVVVPGEIHHKELEVI